MIQLICNKLGVEIEEEWLGSNGSLYRVSNNRKLETYEQSLSTWREESWDKVIVEGIYKVWKPELGDDYYVPDLGEPNLYYHNIFHQEYYDFEYMHNGVMFQTKEEAIKCAKKMLQFLEARR